MSSWTADFAYEQFLAKKDVIQAAERSNEATTRLRAINTLLIDVLGWDPRDIEAEKYCRQTGFADYVLMHGSRAAAIIEAKKDSDTFVLEGREYPEHPVGFELLSRESTSARDAMIQATGYAASLGCKYVAIANGHQFIASLGYVQGVEIDHRSVVVFESLAAIEKRFRLFYRCFSPSGVRANELSSMLLETRKAPAPLKLSAHVKGYPLPADRNMFSNEIGWVLSLVWDTTNQGDGDEEFLRQCYVVPEVTKANLKFATELIEQRTKRDADEGQPSEAIAQSQALQLVDTGIPEKPVIVLGRVGHGKSTFLHYLRLIEASEQLRSYTQVDINFLDRPSTAAEVQRYVFREIDQQLLERYQLDIREAKFARAALDGELRRFRKTVRGSRHPAGSEAQLLLEDEFVEKTQANEYEYLTYAVRHLRRSHHRSLAVFFDNVDRQSDAIQEQAFLQASALSRDWECLVFVCLRPGTYYRSTATGTLDAIAPRVINISSPRPDILLRKRFDFATRVAAGEQVRSGGLQGAAFGRNISMELPSAEAFFSCCRESFTKNRELTSVFAAVANGDIRSMLRFVRDVLTSQHLNTRKIVAAWQSRGYTIAAHEAVRALLLGDSWHYDPNKSVFPNLFDIEHSDIVQHLSGLLALNYLERQSETSVNHGFIANGELTDYLCQLGYSEQHAVSRIANLLRSECIEGRTGETVFTAASDRTRITPLGRYLASDLTGTFGYLDAVVIDTPIVTDSFRTRIRDEQTIQGRVERAKLFLAYLQSCGEQLPDLDARQVWDRTAERIGHDILRVSSRI